MNEKLNAAQELYDLEKYEEAINVVTSIEVGEERELNMNCSLLLAKLWLRHYTDCLKEDTKKEFLKLVETTCSFAVSVEDLWHIEKELNEAIEYWMIEEYQKRIESFEREMGRQSAAMALIDVRQSFSGVAIGVATKLRFNTVVQEYKQTNNLTDKEYPTHVNERIGSPCIGVPKDMAANLELGAARKVYLALRSKCSEMARASAEYINQYRKSYLEGLLNASIVAGLAVDDSDLLASLRRDKLKLRSEILNYVLTAMVYPNGKGYSLYSGPREKYISDLKKDYASLARLDPNFRQPALPPAQAIVPQASGCYVATAVYGSYDCPEVWTLRRFRDDTLAETWFGRAFIRTYYAISPVLVKWFGNSKWFKNMWKPTLDKMVKKLNNAGVDNTAYNDKKW